MLQAQLQRRAKSYTPFRSQCSTTLGETCVSFGPQNVRGVCLGVGVYVNLRRPPIRISVCGGYAVHSNMNRPKQQLNRKRDRHVRISNCHMDWQSACYFHPDTTSNHGLTTTPKVRALRSDNSRNLSPDSSPQPNLGFCVHCC